MSRSTDRPDSTTVVQNVSTLLTIGQPVTAWALLGVVNHAGEVYRPASISSVPGGGQNTVTAMATGRDSNNTITSIGDLSKKFYAQPGAENINVSPPLTASITGTASVCQNGSSPAVTFTGTGGTPPYTFTYTLNGVLQIPVTSTVGSSSVSITVSTASAVTYVFSLVSVQDGTLSTSLVSGSATVTVKPLPTFTPVVPPLPIICLGTLSFPVNYTLATSPDKYTILWNAAAAAAGFTDVVDVSLPLSSFNVAVPSSAPPGIYSGTLSVKITSTGCMSPFTSSSVLINPLPTISGILSVCAGSTTALSGTGTPAGTTPWTSSNNSIASVTNSGVVSGIAAGTVTITYTNNNGCSQKASVTVPSITGNFNVCAGSTTSLIGSGTASGTTPWVSSNTSIATVTNSGVVSGIAAGTVTVTYTNNNGCSQAASVSVNGLPTISGTLSTCAGSTTSLSGSGTASGTTPWVSSNTAIATVNSAGIVSGITAGTVTITYTNNNGCSRAASLTVNSLPTITGTFSICAGTTTPLTGSGTASGTTPWISSNASIGTVSSSGIVSGITAGTVSITYTNNNGCIRTASVTVNALPAIAGTLSICSGTTTSLIGSGVASGTTPWVSSNTAIASVSSSGLVSGITSGTVTITYINNNGCSQAASVTVNALPAITGTLSVCAGLTTSLIGSGVASGTTPWVSSNTAIASVSSSGLVSGITSGTVTITYINNNGCSQAASVTVNALPAITGTLSVCAGSTTSLIGSGVASGTTPWASSNAAIATVSSSGLVSGISAGTITVTYTNNNGCSQAVPVTVSALPVIMGTLSVCAGSTTSLIGSGVASGTIPWASSNTAIAIVSSSGLVSGISAGTITVTYTNNNGCSQAVPVTVRALPAITGTLSVCAGSTTSLIGSGVASGTTPWASSNAATATVSSSGLVSGISAGTITVTYTNNNGCSFATLFTVNPMPVITPITGTTTLCLNTASTLQNMTTGGLWSSNNTSVATVSNGLVTAVATGSAMISYTVTNTTGCVQSAAVTVTVVAAPAIPIITPAGATSFCAGRSVILQSNSGTGNQWYRNNVLIPGAAGQTYAANTSGTYTITVTNGPGCVLNSPGAGIIITVNPLPAAPIISGPSAVCAVSTINLTGSPASGNWSSSNQAIASISGSGVLTGQTAGAAVITYTYTDPNGCSASATAGITVNAQPVISVSPANASISSGGTVMLTASGASGYVWMPVAGLASNNTATVAASPITTTTYTVSGTDANGCSNNASIAVTVNAAVFLGGVIGGDQSVCKGSTPAGLISVSPPTGGTGNYIYQWESSTTSATTGFTDISGATSDIYMPGALTTTTYFRRKVTTSVNPVIPGNTITVIVKPLPVITITPNPANITNGGSIDLTASGASVYTWTPASGLSSTNNAAVTASPAVTTNYTVTGSDINGCINTASLTVNVSGPIAAPFTAGIISGNQSVCPGAAAGKLLSVSAATGGTGNYIYQWQSSITSSATGFTDIKGATAVDYAPASLSVTTYFRRAVSTGVDPLITGNVVMVTVISPPLATVTASGPTNFCSGGSVLLAAAAGNSYMWSTGANTQSINVASPGNYSVTVTNASNCSVTSAVMSIMVNPLPVLVINEPAAVCSPAAVDITLASITAGSTTGSVYSYWTNAASTNPLTTPSAINASGIFYIKSTVAATGCSVIKPITVTINQQPALVINTPAAVCAPATVDLTANAVTSGSMPGLAFTRWRNAAATTPLLNDNVVQASGIYYIKGMLPSGCAAVLPVQVTINPPPSLLVNNPPGVCGPAMIDLTSSSITLNSTPGLIYSRWLNAAATVPLINEGAVTDSGTYYIKGLLPATGCSSIMPVIVSINAPPSGTIAQPAANYICTGSSLALQSSSAKAVSYQWYADQQLIPGATGAGYAATAAGNYSVQFTSGAGCTSFASNSIRLDLLTPPVLSFTASGKCMLLPVTFNNTSTFVTSGGLSWAWDFGDGGSSNVTSPVHIYRNAGTYNITLTANNTSCSSFTGSLTNRYTIEAPLPGTRYPVINTFAGTPALLQARTFGIQYLWQPPAGLNNIVSPAPTAIVRADQAYTVAITSGAGCITTDSVLVRIIRNAEIFVPQAFTPNGDGRNDRLFPILEGVAKLMYFRVFNRWGNMIFQTDDARPESGWTGKYNGAEQPAGTYTWMAEAADLDGKMVLRSGSVMLIK